VTPNITDRDRSEQHNREEKETSMDRALNALRRRRKNQKGFTLIEMLVVISILGILAAVVTMSMVGVVNLAQSRANAAELRSVQIALDTMATQQQLDAAGVCSTSAVTNDMGAFPDGAPQANQPTGTRQALWPAFLRNPQKTHRLYSCDANGTVHDHGDAPPGS
jgi:prepilin-type N-terminal cleavage/methylation domain-containing protein